MGRASDSAGTKEKHLLCEDCPRVAHCVLSMKYCARLRDGTMREIYAARRGFEKMKRQGRVRVKVHPQCLADRCRWAVWDGHKLYCTQPTCMEGRDDKKRTVSAVLAETGD